MGTRAIDFSVSTVVLPEPKPLGDGVPAVIPELSFRVEHNLSISTLLDRDITVTGQNIAAYLHVPELPETDPCINLSSAELPQNVTRRDNIPDTRRNALVGVAPWLSDHPECAKSYIEATSQHEANRALIFFPTDANAGFAAPVGDIPDWGVDQSEWDDWTAKITYPIFAIPPDLGAMIIQEMGIYSGNVSESPFGANLSQSYPGENAVRLYSEITLDSPRGANPVLGRLWIFAIMILGILCGLTVITSLILHLNQRRLRRDLRRRIAAGQVNLEALGIKRQRVPQKLLAKMPLYVYTSTIDSSAPGKQKEMASSSQPSPAWQRKNLPKRQVPFSQTSCAICLEDFRHNESVVRELPCQHIFHPECVDDFLRTNSSLCPMCKKSALPEGYCPDDITIAMVRRERMVRRMRLYGTTMPSFAYVLPSWSHRFLPDSLLRRNIRPRQGAERRPGSGDRLEVVPSANRQEEPTPATLAPGGTASPAQSPATEGGAGPGAPLSPSTMTRSGDLEMGTRTRTRTPSPPPLAAEPQSLEDLPPEIQALSPEERREWGRRRLIATLPPTEADPIAEEHAAEAQLPGWQRAWRRLFPV